MKRILVAVMALALFSCSRDADDDLLTTTGDLEGNWRMVAVRDNTTGFTHVKPGAITGDVDVTFVAVNATNGFLNGRTPSNTFGGDYRLGEIDVITIAALAYSKVAETSWGLDFLNNASKADTYAFEQSGRLRIHTEKKTLIFKRN